MHSLGLCFFIPFPVIVVASVFLLKGSAMPLKLVTYYTFFPNGKLVRLYNFEEPCSGIAISSIHVQAFSFIFQAGDQFLGDNQIIGNKLK